VSARQPRAGDYHPRLHGRLHRDRGPRVGEIAVTASLYYILDGERRRRSRRNVVIMTVIAIVLVWMFWELW